VLETALFLPIVLLLLLGTVEIARITYTYYALQKTMYTLARYLGTQQGVNFCDDSNPAVIAAKNFAVTGTTDGSGAAVITNLTADMLSVRSERVNSAAGTLDQCDCSTTGCDTTNGGLSPDFIVVSIPQGYPMTPHIPLLPMDPIPLKPEIRVPFGGT
jgi:Flp pilus assembly protein TadG